MGYIIIDAARSVFSAEGVVWLLASLSVRTHTYTFSIEKRRNKKERWWHAVFWSLPVHRYLFKDFFFYYARFEGEPHLSGDGRLFFLVFRPCVVFIGKLPAWRYPVCCPPPCPVDCSWRCDIYLYMILVCQGRSGVLLVLIARTYTVQYITCCRYRLFCGFR